MTNKKSPRLPRGYNHYAYSLSSAGLSKFADQLAAADKQRLRHTAGAVLESGALDVKSLLILGINFLLTELDPEMTTGQHETIQKTLEKLRELSEVRLVASIPISNKPIPSKTERLPPPPGLFRSNERADPFG